MAHLSISLFGAYRVSVDQRPIPAFKTIKAHALLAYLAVERGRVHDRAALGGLLWPDHDESAARNNLRQTLYRLRRALGDRSGDSAYFQLTRHTIQFQPTAAYWLDAVRLADALPPAGRRLSPDVAPLEQAVQLYRGHFLAHLYLDDSAEFESWAEQYRRQMLNRVLPVLYHLAAHHTAHGRMEQAAAYAQRQIDLDPVREEGYRQLMRILAAQGRRTTAVGVYEQCRRLLADEVGVQPTPQTADLHHQIVSGQLSRTIHRAAPAPLSTETDSAAPLPPPATPFIGSTAVLAHIAALLAEDGCRLLTLTGLPGSGKSALAVEAARRMQDRFSGRILFVSTAACTTGAQVRQTVADALGVSEPELRPHLRQAPTLLLLDGSSGWHEACIWLTDLPAACPHLRLLVTARTPTGLSSAWGMTITGLAQPADRSAVITETDLTPTEPPPADSVQLFVHTARRIDSQFALTSERRTAVGRICRLLEGHPQAIMWAAGWVRAFACTEIADQIEENAHFLTAGQSLSLAELLARPWARLTADEKEMLIRLSVFRGGATAAAVQAVTDLSAADLLPLIQRGIVRRANGRFSLPPLWQQFAGQQRSAEQTAALRDVHGRYYAAWLGGRTEALAGGGRRAAMRAIHAERRNVRHMWRWLVADGPAALIPAVAPACILYAEMGAGWARLRPLVAAGLQAAHLRADSAARGWLHLAHGYLLRADRETSAAARAFAAAGRQADTVEVDTAGENTVLLRALALTGHAAMLSAGGQPAAAQEPIRQAFELCRTAGLTGTAAQTLCTAAEMALAHGRVEHAHQCVQHARHLLHALQDRWQLAFCHLLEGDIAAAEQRFTAADDAYRRAMRLWPEVGDHGRLALVFARLGALARTQRQWPAARRWYTACLTTARAHEDAGHVVQAQMQLGRLARHAGQATEAQTHYLAGFRWAVRQRWPRRAVGLLAELGEMWREQQAVQAGAGSDWGAALGTVPAAVDIVTAFQRAVERDGAPAVEHARRAVGRVLSSVEGPGESAVDAADLLRGIEL